MVELFLGFYGFLMWLVFKKLRLLPVNLWTMTTSVFILLVVFGLGFMFLGRYQPMTSHAQTFAVSTPIVAEVRGRVVEVVPEGTTRVAKGDLLFRLDDGPYRARVDALTAQLGVARERLTRQEELLKRGSATDFEVSQSRGEADRLEAELRGARYDLDATTVEAPAAGYVTQVLIRPGQVVTPVAFNRVMVFVHDEGPYLAAGFKQNQVEFIDPGDEAEVAFAALPGRVFAAEVRSVQPALSEGVATSSGRLISLDAARPGSLPVLLELTQDVSGYNLPAGSAGIVTVYTGKKHHLDLLRKVILRIKSWEHWVIAPGGHGGGGGGGH